METAPDSDTPPTKARTPPAIPGALLVSEPDARRGGELSRALAGIGYDVIPTVSLGEALRFAGALEGAVLVVAEQLLDSPEDLRGEIEAVVSGQGHLLIVLGSGVLQGAEDPPASSFPEGALWLTGPADAPEALAHRIHLQLLGQTLGISPTPRRDALVGDLAQFPLLELVRSLGRGRASCQVALRQGHILLSTGEVAAASMGQARGVKAFLRLSRLGEGLFHVIPADGDAEPAREIEENLDALVVSGIEASLLELPDSRCSVGVEVGPALFQGGFSPLQQEVLAIASVEGRTLGELLDGIDAPDHRLLEEMTVLEELGVLVREEPQPRVFVVTDSTSDLPADLAREHGIRVMPLTVHFGDRTFLDRVDLQPGQFYDLLGSERAHPSSSPPEPEAFAKVFEEYRERGEIVSLHISAALSQTWEHARQAGEAALAGASEKDPGKAAALEVVDSRRVSLGLGLLALFAARMAARGQSATAIRQLIEGMRSRIETLFIVDTLEYLARGGRIGRASAWLGGLLRIRPILGVKQGEIVPVDRVRGGRSAQQRLVELLAERMEEDTPLMGGIAHANAPVWADRLRSLVEERFPFQELLIGEMGPVVGSHAGPGAVGIAVFQPTAEEIPLIAPLEALDGPPS